MLVAPEITMHKEWGKFYEKYLAEFERSTLRAM